MLASLLAWANFNLALVFWTKFVSISSCCLSVTNCDPNKAAWSPYVEAKSAWSAWIIFVNSATLFSWPSITPFNLLILDIIFCCSVKSNVFVLWEILKILQILFAVLIPIPKTSFRAYRIFLLLEIFLKC